MVNINSIISVASPTCFLAEYHEGLDWIANKLSFEVNKNLNCFEVTIRALGRYTIALKIENEFLILIFTAGLLSAYHLTSDKILLEKSTDLGDRLIHCFDSNSKVPFSDVNLKTRVPIALGSNHDSSLAEVATMQIEFRDLSHETKNDEYEVSRPTVRVNIDFFVCRANHLPPRDIFTSWLKREKIHCFPCSLIHFPVITVWILFYVY